MRALLLACITLLLTACASPPRIAVITAFAPELALLQTRVVDPAKTTINGVEFTTGKLQGKPVVLFQSGISIAADNSARVLLAFLERF